MGRAAHPDEPWQFQLFNLGCIAGYQNLLLLIALPASAALAAGPARFGAIGVVATALFLVWPAGESIADNQQWAFQQRKRAGVATGFLTAGLFRFSRHPNSVGAGAGPLDPSIIGAVLLTLLFAGSTGFTESLTRSRCPDDASYQRTTSRLIPWRPSGSPGPRSRDAGR